jgi:hypothetical protein
VRPLSYGTSEELLFGCLKQKVWKQTCRNGKHHFRYFLPFHSASILRKNRYKFVPGNSFVTRQP